MLCWLTQVLLPDVEVLPAGQSKHTLAPAAEYVPAEQFWQVVSAVAPTIVEYLPAGHDIQASSPIELLYVPAIHFRQLFPFSVCPGGQAATVQSLKAILPSGEVLPVGQAVQD
jgi:hypothetical protein